MVHPGTEKRFGGHAQGCHAQVCAGMSVSTDMTKVEDMPAQTWAWHPTP
jgi:hypothetical protein